MSGLDRYVAVLSLYSESIDLLSVQEIADCLEMPTSTVYRIVRDLVKASFLEPATGARYRIGSAFPSLDLVARKADPMVRASLPLMPELVRQAGIPCVALLARLSNDIVLCVGHESAPQVDFEWSLFERGRPIPMTMGSAAPVILAQLPAAQRRKLLAAQDGERAQSLAADNDYFSAIRKRGYHISTGEIDPKLVALAAPVSAPDLGVFASVGLIYDAGLADPDREKRLALLLISSAALIRERLESADRPAYGTAAQ